MKRKSSSSADKRRRKSARLSQPSPASTPSLNIAFEELESAIIDEVSGFTEPQWYRDIHNRFLPFAQNNTSTSYQRAVSTHNVAAAKTYREIEETLEAYRKKFLRQFDTLKRQTWGFVEATLDLPEAYEGGDLLCACKVNLEE